MPEDLFDYPNLNPSKPFWPVLLEIEDYIRGFQGNKQGPAAFALMVWLHSLRACLVPEIRHLGQEMWRELQRGFPHLIEGWQVTKLIVSDPIRPSIIIEAEFIPPMLEPFRDKERP